MTIPKEKAWNALNRRIVACERCSRLRQYCQEIALQKRAAFQEWDYWGRPVPNFGDPAARVVIVGLAPAAHGGNRTGRAFTGDRSGDWLYRALHKAGFANQPTSVARDDGLQLTDCAITNPCHCAPPENKPTSEEIANCSEWFAETMELLPVKVIVALGQTAWKKVVNHSFSLGWLDGRRPQFGHGADVPLDNHRRWLLGCFHPSPRNTFTGRLTEPMLDAVFSQVKARLSPLQVQVPLRGCQFFELRHFPGRYLSQSSRFASILSDPMRSICENNANCWSQFKKLTNSPREVSLFKMLLKLGLFSSANKIGPLLSPDSPGPR